MLWLYGFIGTLSLKQDTFHTCTICTQSTSTNTIQYLHSDPRLSQLPLDIHGFIGFGSHKIESGSLESVWDSV